MEAKNTQYVPKILQTCHMRCGAYTLVMAKLDRYREKPNEAKQNMAKDHGAVAMNHGDWVSVPKQWQNPIGTE